MTHENGLAVKVLLCEEPYACLNGFYVDLWIKDGFLNDRLGNKTPAFSSLSPAYSLLKRAKQNSLFRLFQLIWGLVLSRQVPSPQIRWWRALKALELLVLAHRRPRLGKQRTWGRGCWSPNLPPGLPRSDHTSLHHCLRKKSKPLPSLLALSFCRHAQQWGTKLLFPYQRLLN